MNNLVLRNVKELRFVFCPKSVSSLGLRNWLTSNFVPIKLNNPEALLIIRECENSIPNILARYEFGVERKVSVEFASSEEIQEIVEKKVKDADKINSYISK